MNNKLISMLSNQTASQVADLFHQISDTNRVQLIYILSKREINIRALADLTGINASTISRQLRDLRQMRLIRFHRQGKEVFYNMPDLHTHMILYQALLHIRQSEASHK
jgi:ArsR family transcriptional regulator